MKEKRMEGNIGMRGIEQKKCGRMLSVFLLISLLVLTGVRLNDLLRQKWDYSNDNAAQQIVRGFYREEEDTLDVLYLGASTIRNGVSPLQIWSDYGFTGYSRATSVQAPVISYCLLQETLETQKNIKAVVVDATILTDITNNDKDKEGKYHEAIDYMPLSKYKVRIIDAITKTGEFSKLDFLLPLYRYHDRWSELKEKDFTYHVWEKDYRYKGQYPIIASFSYTFPDDYMEEEIIQDSDFSISGEAVEYFAKIADLCLQKDIRLIVVKTPITTWDWKRHEMIANYAAVNHAEFIDFNLPELQAEIGFDAKTDFCDAGRHPNISGAQKISRYLGGYLDELCEFQDKRQDDAYSRWWSDYELYDNLLCDKEVAMESNFYEFIDKINNPDYTIVVAARNDTAKYFTDDIKTALANLGLSVDLGAFSNQSYGAVICNGDVVFEKSAIGQSVYYYGKHMDREILLTSFADKATGNNASIMIDGIEYSMQQAGLNFVIYDNSVGQVVARKVFNTGKTGKLYTRK